MLKENLKDAGQTVQMILTENLPLLNDSAKTVSLLSAAKSFLESNDPATSDLKKFLAVLQHYPDATRMMVQELNLICSELENLQSRAG